MALAPTSLMADRMRYRVSGMDCSSCAQKVDAAVRRVPGVAEVSVSAQVGTITVTLAEGAADLRPAIDDKVAALGYGATLLSDGRTRQQPAPNSACCSGGSCGTTQNVPGAPGAGQEAAKRGHDEVEVSWWRTGKAQLTLIAGAGLAAAWLLGNLLPGYTSWLYVAAMVVGLVPIARRAVRAAVNGSPFTIETLMTIAASGAIVIVFAHGDPGVQAGEEAHPFVACGRIRR
jgi:Cd2+/Zn2+-exporting ATPase